MSGKGVYKAYLLVRLDEPGRETEFCEVLRSVYDRDQVLYAVPAYAPWDVVVEVLFSEMDELDAVVTAVRGGLAGDVSETATMVGARATFPWPE